jgi:Aldehyde dehydrogenase family
MRAALPRFQMLIGGKAVDAASGRTFESQNPFTGQPWAVLPDAGVEDVDAAVAAARAALDGEWGGMTGHRRHPGPVHPRLTAFRQTCPLLWRKSQMKPPCWGVRMELSAAATGG